MAVSAEMVRIRNATANELINMYWSGLLNDKEKLDYAFEMLIQHYEQLEHAVANDFDGWED